MSALVCGRLFVSRALGIASRANFATLTASDPIQRAFVEKLREYQQKSTTAEMGLVGATPAQIKNMKDALEKLDIAFNAKGVDMTQFPTVHHKEPDLVNPGSTIVVPYPEPELMENPEEPERIDGVLTRGPIVI